MLCPLKLWNSSKNPLRISHPLTRTKIPLYVLVKDHPRVEVGTFDPEKKSWLYISENLVFTDDEDIKNDVYLVHLFMKKTLQIL